MNNPEKKFKWKYNINSNRLKWYDYSSEWAYFITICCKDREEHFWEIIDWKMILNKIWKIVKSCYLEIPNHFPNVLLDEYIIMPDHIHFIIFINELWYFVETKNFLSLQRWTYRMIWSIVRGFKIWITKWIRDNKDIDNIWQPNYYDRIIRNEDELNRIRKYIINNPLKWEQEKNENLWIFM